jgi:hypothetical protein
MRHLLQPRVLNQATLAALVSALACFPRLSLWLHRPAPIWYLEAVIFICGIMLWGFVFAWHTPHTHRPVFVSRPELAPFIAATLIASAGATAMRLWLDPLLRLKMPGEYPADLRNWIAALLFSLALTQLFLIFAPFAWLMRMLKRRWLAASLTALFGAAVLAMKIHSLATPLSPPLLAALLAGRLVTTVLAVYFYLRGGVVLVWWWTFLFAARHLPGLIGGQ